MTPLEILEQQAYDEGVNVIEMDMSGTRIKGLYCDSNIALDKNIETSAEKACVLAEELGHHYTTVGNILDQSDASNRKQECQGRLWAYDKQVGLVGLVNAYKAGCQSAYEAAEFLGVSESFLREAIERYRGKYGKCTTIDNYVVVFDPCVAVIELTSYAPEIDNLSSYEKALIELRLKSYRET